MYNILTIVGARGDKMSEICFECLNKTLNGKLDEKNFIISKDLDLCENCGLYKQIVVAERNKYYYLHKFKWLLVILGIVLLPVTIIVLILYRASWKRKLKYKNKK